MAWGFCRLLVPLFLWSLSPHELMAQQTVAQQKVALQTLVIHIGAKNPPPRIAQSKREAIKVSGARESCRQDVAGHYLLAVNDLQFARGTVAASERALAKVAKAAAKARRRLQASRGAYREAPGDFRLKQAAESDYFVVTQLDQQAEALRKTHAEQQAAKAVAGRDRKRILAAIAEVFTIKHTPKAPYHIAIQYQSRCGKFRYICPPSPRESAGIAKIFAGAVIPRDCQRFLGQLREL